MNLWVYYSNICEEYFVLKGMPFDDADLLFVAGSRAEAERFITDQEDTCHG